MRSAGVRVSAMVAVGGVELWVVAVAVVTCVDGSVTLSLWTTPVPFASEHSRVVLATQVCSYVTLVSEWTWDSTSISDQSCLSVTPKQNIVASRQLWRRNGFHQRAGMEMTG